MVHAQQRPVTAAGPAEVVAIATGQAVRAVTPVTASAVVSTTVSPVRSLVTQVTGNELIIGFLQVHILFYSPDLSSVLFHASTVLSQGKPISAAQLHVLRQHLPQATSPQMKAVSKAQVGHYHLYRITTPNATVTVAYRKSHFISWIRWTCGYGYTDDNISALPTKKCSALLCQCV